MRAAIFSCAGPVLAADERSFFADADPYGFILFRRHCHAPDQLRALVADLRDSVGRRAPVLIDQEGGRIQRMAPPVWRQAPAPGLFGTLYRRDPETARDLARLNAHAIARELQETADIDVNCAPLLDLQESNAHDVIGDRAFSADPGAVAELGAAWIAGLRAGGVVPVIKHLPGHGRARADSHHALPVIDAPVAELEQRDFAPFRAVVAADPAVAGMTGHLLFPAIDPERPVTLSRQLVTSVIREHVGLAGLLISDDISMQALEGPVGERAAAACAAGCDVALHCNGRMEEMQAIADAVPALGGTARERALALVAESGTLRAGAVTTPAGDPDRRLAAALRSEAGAGIRRSD